MPFRRSSSPQIGIEPMLSSASFFAASSAVSFSPMHLQSGVMMSRAVFPAIGTSFGRIRLSHPAYPHARSGEFRLDAVSDRERGARRRSAALLRTARTW